MHKDTPPSSPHFDPGNMDDVDAILDEEDVEVFEIDEHDLDEFEDAEMEESAQPITDDAEFVFTKHTSNIVFHQYLYSKFSFISYFSLFFICLFIFSESVFCGSLSKDSKLAVTGGEDDKAYVWDTTKGDVMLECTYNESVIFADFNHNDTLLATGDMNGVIQVWNLNDNKLIWDNQISEITVSHLYIPIQMFTSLLKHLFEVKFSFFSGCNGTWQQMCFLQLQSKGRFTCGKFLKEIARPYKVCNNELKLLCFFQMVNKRSEEIKSQ